MASATYVSVRIADLGGGAAEVGLSNGIAWGAEVPGLIMAGWFVTRFGLRPVLALAAAGYAACVASFIVFGRSGPILFARLLSGVFFGLILVAFVLSIAQLLPGRLQATGQTLFQAAAFGVAAVVANLLGGILYSVADPWASSVAGRFAPWPAGRWATWCSRVSSRLGCRRSRNRCRSASEGVDERFRLRTRYHAVIGATEEDPCGSGAVDSRVRQTNG